MGAFATNTPVPVDRTRAEIERLLDRYGASRFAHAREGNMGTGLDSDLLADHMGAIDRELAELRAKEPHALPQATPLLLRIP